MKRQRHATGRRQRNARLGSFEHLEARRLFAVAAFTVSLYEDAGGVPGDEITDSIVDPEEKFFVEIAVEDIRTQAWGPEAVHGIASAAVDLDWDPAVLSVVEEAFAPSDVNNPVMHPSFSVWRRGELDNERGSIRDLQGVTVAMSRGGDLLGDAGPERLSLIQFQASDTPGTTELRIEGGQGGIALWPTVFNGNASQYDFEQIEIEVRASSPRVEPSEGESEELEHYLFHRDALTAPETTSPDSVDPSPFVPGVIGDDVCTVQPRVSDDIPVPTVTSRESAEPMANDELDSSDEQTVLAPEIPGSRLVGPCLPDLTFFAKKLDNPRWVDAALEEAENWLLPVARG
ncbi:MAG: hypothetical protein KDA60_22750 [Planctomycetales bacterium]|nr:hypothetical protein [Planctomycetales bacterium]